MPALPAVDVRDHDGGALLKVRAQPGARRNAVTGVHDQGLKVCVSAPPDQGRANEAIAGVLAEAFQLKPSAISLISGAASRTKQFHLRGISAADVRRCLEELLDGSRSRPDP